jgi:hypothetical protein
MDERLGLFPGGQQTAPRTSSKMGAAASRSDSTGGAHRDGDSQLRAGRYPTTDRASSAAVSKAVW